MEAAGLITLSLYGGVIGFQWAVFGIALMEVCTYLTRTLTLRENSTYQF